MNVAKCYAYKAPITPHRECHTLTDLHCCIVICVLSFNCIIGSFGEKIAAGILTPHTYHKYVAILFYKNWCCSV